MKIKSQRDFGSGLMFIVVGIAFAWGATEYSFGTSARPGAGYFPFGLGVLLATLGGMVLFKALSIESEGGDPIGNIAWRPLLVMVATILVFGLALPRLGLVITLGLLVGMALPADRENGFVSSAIAAVAGTAIAALLLAYVVPLSLSLLAPITQSFAIGSRGFSIATAVVGVLGRVLPFALLAFLLLRLAPKRARALVETILLAALLICFSRWIFVDGLGLSLPIWPTVVAG
jgi:Tripartite tricarboxylate transporter TctB family